MNNIDMQQVAQKLLNKMALAEYQQTILEAQNEKLAKENELLKKQLEEKKENFKTAKK